MNTRSEKPAIPRADTLPADGYVLSVDGKLKGRFEEPEQALAAAVQLKQAYPVLHVQVFDAQARSYKPVLVPDPVLLSED